MSIESETLTNVYKSNEALFLMMFDTVLANVHGLYFIPHAGVGLTACISIVIILSLIDDIVTLYTGKGCSNVRLFNALC